MSNSPGLIFYKQFQVNQLMHNGMIFFQVMEGNNIRGRYLIIIHQSANL